MNTTERAPPESVMLEEASTADLVREAFDEAKELARIEIALAKEEVRNELERAKRAAIAFGLAAGAVVLVLCALTTALIVALGGTIAAAIGVAGGLLVFAALAGAVGYLLLPKSPLLRTRSRIENDVRQLKENVAMKERAALEEHVV